MNFRALIVVAVASTTWFVAAGADELPAIVEHVAARGGRGATFSIPLDRYRGDLRRLPIGVFDSGIGGLTVLEEILKLDRHDNASGKPGADGVPDFAGERFVYLADQANMPYGNYSSVGKTEFLRELIVRDGIFLLGDRYWPDAAAAEPQHDKPPVKAIVIACNTATAYGLDDLRGALAKWNVPIPIVGVVEAGGRGAIDALRDDPAAGAAAVLATVGTCASGAYPKAIARSAGQQGLPAPVVRQQGSVGLAGAIEGNPAFLFRDGSPATAATMRLELRPELAAAYAFESAGLDRASANPHAQRLGSIENHVRFDVTTLVDDYRRAGGTKPITTVVLGCTHYPLAARSIEQAFLRLRDYRDASGDRPYRALIGERLTLVNPGEYAARELFRELFRRRLRLPAGETSVAAQDLFFATVPSPETPPRALAADGGFADDYKFGRSAGGFDAEDVRTVPMATDDRMQTAVATWRTMLPQTAARMPTSAAGRPEN